ncbi:LCP family protein [Salicibibacter kimchii]|nr:LCP family protein [Salicibibacter kimchii]
MDQRKRVLYTLTVVGVLVLLAIGVGVYNVTSHLDDVTEQVNEPLQRGKMSEKRESVVEPEMDNISVLFMGLDNRESELNGLADAMVLATFNREEGTIKSLSIPRDACVQIPGRMQKDKINHAHAFGGADLAVETVEDLLDIPVDYYVTFNFDAFMDIIDVFDGVDVDVPFAFSEQDAGGSLGAIQFDEGEQTLNGEEALAYVRMRYQDPTGDFGRMERQQEVMEQLADKAMSFQSIAKYTRAFHQLEDNMNFNFSFTELVSLQPYTSNLKKMDTYQLDGTERWENGIFYFDIDDESLTDVASELCEHLELDEA